MRMAHRAEETITAYPYQSMIRQLVQAHAILELRPPNGAVTLEVPPLHLADELLATEEDTRLMLYGAFQEDTNGRKGYTDRDPPVHRDRRYEDVTR